MKTKLITIFLLLSINSINLPARYYNPKIGRFITADNAAPGGGANLQGLNRYSYCNNNPVVYIDPTGHEPDVPDATYVHIEPPKLYNETVLRANLNTPEYSKYTAEQFDKEYSKMEFQAKLQEYRNTAINFMAFLGPEGALLSASLHIVVNDDVKTGLMIAGGTLAFKGLERYVRGYNKLSSSNLEKYVRDNKRVFDTKEWVNKGVLVQHDMYSDEVFLLNNTKKGLKIDAVTTKQELDVLRDKAGFEYIKYSSGSFSIESHKKMLQGIKDEIKREKLLNELIKNLPEWLPDRYK